jgi:glyoxylase-like metal-dependent hydrolase (beta-lactamase superfamily II)
MKQVSSYGVLIAAAVALCGCAKQDAIEIAAKNLNVESTDSIRIVGDGMWAMVGQAYSSSGPWVQIPVSDYTLTIDYVAGASHLQMTRTEPTEGDADQNLEFRKEYYDFLKSYQVELHSGTSAWNVMVNDRIVVRPDRVGERIAAARSTPHGFIKLARQNDAQFRSTGNGGETSFTVGNLKFHGRFNAQGDLELVQTWIDNPVMGDMLVETQFKDYKDYDGIRFPSHITRLVGGQPALDLTVKEVRVNVAADITVPDSVKNYQAPPINVVGEPVAPGVWHMRSGSHNSLLIEMADHLIVVESSQDEERSQAVIAKAKEIGSGKPIRYIVNTHTHFDHSGGLRTYVAEGATVVTNAANVEFYKKAWSAPRTINPDAMAKANVEPKFLPVSDKVTLSDGARLVNIYEMRGVHHAESNLMVHLPAEKVISVADIYRPGDPGAPPPEVPLPGAVQLLENMERVGALDVTKVACMHGRRVGSIEELLIDAGRAQPKGGKGR